MALSLIRCSCCNLALSKFYLFLFFSTFYPLPPSRPFFLIHTFLAGLTCDTEVVSDQAVGRAAVVYVKPRL